MKQTFNSLISWSTAVKGALRNITFFNVEEWQQHLEFNGQNVWNSLVYVSLPDLRAMGPDANLKFSPTPALRSILIPKLQYAGNFMVYDAPLLDVSTLTGIKSTKLF